MNPTPQNEDFNNTTIDSSQKSNKNIILLVYILQATSFVVGVTFFIGVVINYIKRDELAGSWLASHNRWQMRTFWFSLLWTVIGLVTSMIVIGWVILLVNALWVIYRIAKGWISLSENKPMYSL
ncbi:MAG TPA: hypothetical protein VIC26_07110 [Marinagarivorans sp.]